MSTDYVERIGNLTWMWFYNFELQENAVDYSKKYVDKYPYADIKIVCKPYRSARNYNGQSYHIIIVFHDEADEAEFIMKEIG